MIQADLDQLGALSSNLGQCSGDVTDLMTRLTGLIQNTTWQGGAATRFRDAWDSQFRPTLTQLADALTDASTEVSNRQRALNLAGN